MSLEVHVFLTIVTFPSAVGGPNWGPPSYNPQLDLVFINIHNTGSHRPAHLFLRGEEDSGSRRRAGREERDREQAGRQGEGPPTDATVSRIVSPAVRWRRVMHPRMARWSPWM